MSLFPSAFDIASAGPSSTVFTALPTAKPNKRKRPSLAKGERDHQLRATQANLEKLMNKVEKGAVREKGHGSDAMGLPSQTKTKKKKKTDGHPNETRDPIKKEKSREPRVTHQRPNPKDKNKSASAKAPLPPQNIRAADPDLAEGGEEGLTDMQKGMKVKLEGARFR